MVLNSTQKSKNQKPFENYTVSRKYPIKHLVKISSPYGHLHFKKYAFSKYCRLFMQFFVSFLQLLEKLLRNLKNEHECAPVSPPIFNEWVKIARIREI